MNSINSQTNTNLVSKFKSALISKIEEKVNIDIQNYNFKSQENVFMNTFDQKEFRNLNGFTLLTILDRFFYTDPNSKVTYISNVIVDKSESISFSLGKSKVSLFGKDEFNFDELDKLCYEGKGLNRKIILVGVYEGKLTKLESQVTSERTILLYLKNSNNENTVDIGTAERKYKENTVNVLSLTKSRKQIPLSDDEENDFYKDLTEHIININNNLYIKESPKLPTPINPPYTIIPQEDIQYNNQENAQTQVEEDYQPAQENSNEKQLTFDFSNVIDDSKTIEYLSGEQSVDYNS